MKPAANTTPGKRTTEGSSSDGAFVTLKPNTGQLTPPGLKSYPSGAPTVEYQNGASTPCDFGLDPGSSVSSVPLTYTKS